MQNTFAESIVALKILTDRMCEGQNKTNGLFLASHQMLFVLYKEGTLSPSVLKTRLGLAKSNLAILAKQLIKKGLISSNKNYANRKEVYYSLTKEGEDELMQKLDQIENSIPEKLKAKAKDIENVANELQNINK